MSRPRWIETLAGNDSPERNMDDALEVYDYKHDRYGSLLMHIDRYGSKWSDRTISEKYTRDISEEERHKLRSFLGGPLHDSRLPKDNPGDWVPPADRRYPGWVRNTAADCTYHEGPVPTASNKFASVLHFLAGHK